MALSNWDTLALDEKSASISGAFKSPLGVVVEFYKNWLYIRDEKAWEEKGSFTKPTVMQVTSGELRYKDVNILALRGPQNGVYAVVWTGYGDVVGMIGCGVYGYEGDEFVGVLGSSIEWFKKELSKKGSDTMQIGDEARPYEFDVYDIPKPFKEIDWGKGLRFNQGDAYFAGALGGDIPATEPEKAEPTVMSQILDKMT